MGGAKIPIGDPIPVPIPESWPSLISVSIPVMSNPASDADWRSSLALLPSPSPMESLVLATGASSVVDTLLYLLELPRRFLDDLLVPLVAALVKTSAATPPPTTATPPTTIKRIPHHGKVVDDGDDRAVPDGNPVDEEEEDDEIGPGQTYNKHTIIKQG